MIRYLVFIIFYSEYSEKQDQKKVFWNSSHLDEDSPV